SYGWGWNYWHRPYWSHWHGHYNPYYGYGGYGYGYGYGYDYGYNPYYNNGYYGWNYNDDNRSGIYAPRNVSGGHASSNGRVNTRSIDRSDNAVHTRSTRKSSSTVINRGSDDSGNNNRVIKRDATTRREHIGNTDRGG